MQVNLEGLAKSVDEIREGLEPRDGEVDHRAGILYTASECLRQADKLERQVVRVRELYESSMAIVRRYQGEREGLLDRVEQALLGIEGSRFGRRWVTLRRTSNSG
jgi:hypothetical protein